jgi:hypothetical protein
MAVPRAVLRADRHAIPIRRVEGDVRLVDALARARRTKRLDVHRSPTSAV